MTSKKYLTRDTASFLDAINLASDGTNDNTELTDGWFISYTDEDADNPWRARSAPFHIWAMGEDVGEAFLYGRRGDDGLELDHAGEGARADFRDGRGQLELSDLIAVPKGLMSDFPDAVRNSDGGEPIALDERPVANFLFSASRDTGLSLSGLTWSPPSSYTQ